MDRTHHSRPHLFISTAFDVKAARSGLAMEQTTIGMTYFYVDDEVLSACNPVWLQSTFNVLFDLFKRVSFVMNAKKTQVVTCVPEMIRESWTK